MCFLNNFFPSVYSFSRHHLELPDDLREQEGRGRIWVQVDRLPLYAGLVHPGSDRRAPVRSTQCQWSLRIGKQHVFGSSKLNDMWESLPPQKTPQFPGLAHRGTRYPARPTLSQLNYTIFTDLLSEALKLWKSRSGYNQLRAAITQKPVLYYFFQNGHCYVITF